MNGELVDWADAKVHVGVHGLHYGTGVFEGIRCYDTPKGPEIFRLTDHLARLHNSARLLYMEIPFPVEELKAACNELIAENGLPECYVRPIAFYGYGELGVAARLAEHRPARVEGDRRLPELDARGHRGEQRGVRRGDPAHAGGARRRRLG